LPLSRRTAAPRTRPSPLIIGQPGPRVNGGSGVRNLNVPKYTRGVPPLTTRDRQGTRVSARQRISPGRLTREPQPVSPSLELAPLPLSDFLPDWPLADPAPSQPFEWPTFTPP
jgi:hypothetical protein